MTTSNKEVCEIKLKKEYENLYEKEIEEFLDISPSGYWYRKFIVDKLEELAAVLEKDDVDKTTLTLDKIQDMLMPIAGGGSGFQFDMILYMLYRYWYYEPLIIRKKEYIKKNSK